MVNQLTQPTHWNAQVLRLTLFLHRPIDGTGLWERVVGNAPEIDEHKPREQVRRQAGPIGDGVFEVRVTAVPIPRLDWLMAPMIVGEAVPSVHFGSLDVAMEQFDNLVRPWITKPLEFGVTRLAIGLVAAMPVLDRATGYKRLQQFVPSVRLDAEHTKEILYRVNRPKSSRALVGANLNRITTWNCFSTQSFTVTVGPSAPVHAVTGEEQTFVRCECDNSTPAEAVEPLESALLLPIYDELRQMAIENIERGELP